MISGKVVGQIVCTRKHETLEGLKLNVIETEASGNSKCIVSADSIHVSGIGDQVYLLSSTEAVLAMEHGQVVIDSCIAGIVDPVSNSHEETEK